MGKVLKMKSRKFWGLIPKFADVTGRKPVPGAITLPHPE